MLKHLTKRIICSLKGHNYYPYATNLPHIETLYKCKNCGLEGEEWYSMQFTGHNIYNENGDCIEL